MPKFNGLGLHLGTEQDGKKSTKDESKLAETGTAAEAKDGADGETKEKKIHKDKPSVAGGYSL